MARTQKYKRAKMIGIVEIRGTPFDSPFEAYALDISYGGMAVNLNQPLTGHVEVTTYFTNGSGKKVKETIAGRVIWCKPFGSFYKAGIEFKSLNDHDHPQLLTYIKAFIRSAATQ